jgi:hypothetical protein
VVAPAVAVERGDEQPGPVPDESHLRLGEDAGHLRQRVALRREKQARLLWVHVARHERLPDHQSRRLCCTECLEVLVLRGGDAGRDPMAAWPFPCHVGGTAIGAILSLFLLILAGSRHVGPRLCASAVVLRRRRVEKGQQRRGDELPRSVGAVVLLAALLRHFL